MGGEHGCTKREGTGTDGTDSQLTAVLFDVGVSIYGANLSGGGQSGVPEFAMDVDHVNEWFSPRGNLKMERWMRVKGEKREGEVRECTWHILRGEGNV